MPDRDYYLLDDSRDKDLRTKYEQHVVKMFALLGDAPDKADAEAKTVLAFETDLAHNSKTRVDLRDPLKATTTRCRVADVFQRGSGFRLESVYYKPRLGAQEPGSVDVKQTEFIKHAAEVVQNGSLDDWKTYLRWQSDPRHGSLPEQGVCGGELQLLRQGAHRRDRRSSALEKSPGRDRQRARRGARAPLRRRELPAGVQGPRAGAGDGPSQRPARRPHQRYLGWSGETRKAAVNKLDHFTVKIGYPDKWRDYSALDIKLQPYVLNVHRGQPFRDEPQLSPRSASPWTKPSGA